MQHFSTRKSNIIIIFSFLRQTIAVPPAITEETVIIIIAIYYMAHKVIMVMVEIMVATILALTLLQARVEELKMPPRHPPMEEPQST